MGMGGLGHVQGEGFPPLGDRAGPGGMLPQGEMFPSMMGGQGQGGRGIIGHQGQGLGPGLGLGYGGQFLGSMDRMGGGMGMVDLAAQGWLWTPNGYIPPRYTHIHPLTHTFAINFEL